MWCDVWCVIFIGLLFGELYFVEYVVFVRDCLVWFEFYCDVYVEDFFDVCGVVIEDYVVWRGLDDLGVCLFDFVELCCGQWDVVD